MRFYQKMTLSMLALLSLLFGIGGSLLISSSFQDSLEREKVAAFGDYRMAWGTLQIVNSRDPYLDREAIARHTCAVVELSAKAGTGVQALEEAIRDAVGTAQLDPAAGMVANQRQLDCVLKAARSLDEALNALGWGETLDAVSVVIEEALDALMELTGQRASQEIIDRVFENFCVGK